MSSVKNLIVKRLSLVASLTDVTRQQSPDD